MEQESSTSSITSATFDALNGQIQTSALGVTRRAVGLPLDIGFHRSMDHDLANDLDMFSERVLDMTNRLLSLTTTIDGKGKGKAKLEGQDDVVDSFHSMVVDSMDQLLERTDICLDEFLGRNKAPAIAINPPATTVKPTQKAPIQKGNEPVIQHASHLVKPQLSFKKQPDNSDSPWYPTLSHKYNAKVPLGHIYHDSTAGENILANHPYRYEIKNLAYPSRMFEPCTPVVPPSLEDTQASWVATPADFQRMLGKLRSAKEIAVDLEHHSYRTYSGFLCLVQLSDREEDWVVDLLAMRDEVEALNEVFTNPEVVKVFHGADSDIVWLQQDFNLYIVNLFDTFHASKLLEFPRHGLANLLEMYCDFIPDKRYQLADWRIRPLPEDMLLYARSDTHFLLYIYDNLRNALLDRSQSSSRSPSSSPPPSRASPSASSQNKHLLKEALTRSAETSLRVYAKEPYDATEGGGSNGWNTLAKKWNKGHLMADGPEVGVGAMQREVYRAVHGWRETVAREEDESTRFILQNHFLFQLAEQPPPDMPALLTVFRSSVPPVVKRRGKELLAVVREAVSRGMGMVNHGGNTQGLGMPDKSGESEKPAKGRDVIMLDQEMKDLEEDNGVAGSAPVGNVNIWGQGAAHAKDASTLFGSLRKPLEKVTSSSASSTAMVYAAPASILFGQRKAGSLEKDRALVSSSSVKPSYSYSQVPHFKELFSKITRSLVMAPSIPHILPVPPLPTSSGPMKSEETGTNPQQPPAEGGTEVDVEIPFIAASQRTTKKEEVDTIVLVGQARQKRKREKKTKSSEDSSPKEEGTSAKGAKEVTPKDEVQEAFDFSTVPNILDDNPNTNLDGDGGRRKKKQKKDKSTKGGMFYGDFPAPPKAHSELKNGNQSYTFRK